MNMKTLIVIRESDHAWTRELFSGRHPLLLPVCNKPAVEFLIDFSVLAGSREIRIVGDTPLDDVERLCEDGSRWGVSISYANMLSGDSIEKVLDKNRKFCAAGRVLVISRTLFIRFDYRQDYGSFFRSHPEGPVVSGKSGRIFLTGEPPEPEAVIAPPPLSVVDMDSAAAYFGVSQELLAAGTDSHLLPGYSNEPDCSIGSNVVIQKGVEIIKPVMIGNNVQILSGAVIGSGSIIGNNVIIGGKSHVAESVVLDGTYIGQQLSVNRRIVVGNLLFDPDTSDGIRLEDPHLISGIGSRATNFPLSRRMVHSLFALMMIVFLLVPFLLSIGVLFAGGRRKPTRTLYHALKPDETVILRDWVFDGSGFPASMAAAMSLDRFARLFHVLVGHLALIGSRPAAVVNGPRRSIDNSAGYRPGVFSYAEAEAWPENQLDASLVDRYYLDQGNALNDIAMTLKAIFNRTTPRT